MIVLITEPEDDPDDTPIAEIREGIYRGWQDALAGCTKPVSQLWDALEVDTNDPLFQLAGSITSKIPDLAENHDQYLGEALYEEMHRHQ
mgnify:CR=1 FL=1